MPVMDGLDVAKNIVNIGSPTSVIFTTAYEEHALSALDANAIDYLLKPVRKERLITALEKATLINLSRLNKLRETLPQKPPRTHLSATTMGYIQLIPVDEIFYLKAEQKYVVVGYQDGIVLINDPLKSLEEEFPGKFIRVHRNAIIATKHARAIQKCPEGGYEIVFNNASEKMHISRRYLPKVKDILGITRK